MAQNRARTLVSSRDGLPFWAGGGSAEMGTSERTLGDRLERERNVWFCTTRADCSPHITPVWFVFLDNTFWISSGERNIKVRNVENNPKVSLTLEDGDRPAVAEGRARVHRDTPRKDVLAAITHKYNGWDAKAKIDPFGPRVLIEVPVDRWLLKGTAQ